jgi:hypothetical protein
MGLHAAQEMRGEILISPNLKTCNNRMYSAVNSVNVFNKQYNIISQLIF